VTDGRKGKARVDVLLVERGLAPSRARAQAWIMAGLVRAGGQRIDKAGALVDLAVELSVAAGKSPFVSRGGEKLAGALDHFAGQGLDVAGLVAVDIGASTGGFTDCLLSRGARKVYAVDVGYGLLAERLRSDPRVVVRERTNARLLGPGDFKEPVDLVVVDASFIGIGKLTPAIARLLRPGGALVALVKPQFEAGRRAASLGRGVIRDPAVRAEAIGSARGAVQKAGFAVRAEVDSQVRGPKGNLEHFLYAIRMDGIGRGSSI
jgi:23S rRNA (cytidine1920-2'-O)/16S rRNA (cytidine1409-2'-O)-methyltransferase